MLNRICYCSQNDRITKLKIDNNPFAKGFRACGQSKCKRKTVDTETSAQETQSEPDAKRPCSDAASSCSDESVRSSSPRSPPLIDSPNPIVVDNLSPPFYPPELPYMHLPMPLPLGIWPTNFPGMLGTWSPAPPVPQSIPSPPNPPPCRRIKSFTISALLGEG